MSAIPPSTTGSVGHAREHQRRDAEADQVDDEDRRHAAQDVDEDGREQPQREQRRRAREPRERDDQAEHEHADLDDHEQLDVEPEAVEHGREDVGEVLGREERLAHVRPALARDDRRSTSRPSTTTVETAATAVWRRCARGAPPRGRGGARRAGEARRLLQLGRAGLAAHPLVGDLLELTELFELRRSPCRRTASARSPWRARRPQSSPPGASNWPAIFASGTSAAVR